MSPLHRGVILFAFCGTDYWLWRFVDCEKWRKEFGVDDIVKNFVYVEKPKVFEFYPQFYHKTDKVWALGLFLILNPLLLQGAYEYSGNRTADPFISSSWGRSI